MPAWDAEVLQLDHMMDAPATHWHQKIIVPHINVFVEWTLRKPSYNEWMQMDHDTPAVMPKTRENTLTGAIETLPLDQEQIKLEKARTRMVFLKRIAISIVRPQLPGKDWTEKAQYLGQAFDAEVLYKIFGLIQHQNSEVALSIERAENFHQLRSIATMGNAALGQDTERMGGAAGERQSRDGSLRAEEADDIEPAVAEREDPQEAS